MPVAKRDDYQTPPEIFEPLNAEFGFTIDAAASCENALLPRFWTVEDNALAQDWTGERVWCNPPYGHAMRPFIELAARRDAEVTVMLLPARTDTRIWHECILGQAEVRFLRGRIRFAGEDHAAPFPSAICIWRGEEMKSEVKMTRYSNQREMLNRREYQVGDFCWARSMREGEERDYLIFVYPAKSGGNSFTSVQVRREEWEGHWWDGDRDKPTVTASILIKTLPEEVELWHGYITEGVLKTV